MPASEYDVVIERGRSELNNKIIDFLKTKIPLGPYLDVGCNSGWLLSEVPYGTGVDNSPMMLELAEKKGVDAIYADISEGLPFSDNAFPTVVLSCVLAQLDNPLEALWESMRVAGQRVIGIVPWPNASEWGVPGGNQWTKSQIFAHKLQEFFDAKIEEFDDTHYYFEIKVTDRKKKKPFDV